MERETLDLLKQYAATPGVVGSLGGVAHYFYQVSKGEKFKLTFFIINIFLAGWLSHLLAHFYPYTEFRDSLIGITGFCAYPILKMLEEKFPKFLASKLK